MIVYLISGWINRNLCLAEVDGRGPATDNDWCEDEPVPSYNVAQGLRP
ncbi:hypothetical protein SAMN05216316_1401 [Nitrosovibrio sp. Nv6]|nr:hypothetical protein SAMN05216316_1401 [Nitrosovibrio sp. Nv6]